MKKYLKIPRILASCAVATLLAGCQSPNTQLEEALRFDDKEAAQAAIARGAGIYELPERQRYKLPPFSRAAFLGQVDAVKILIEAGADPNRPDNYGWRPIHYAVMQRGAARSATLEVLLQAKVNVNAKLPAKSLGAPPDVKERSDGATPLILAALGAFSGNCELLLKHGAKVDARDAEGRTAFWHTGGKMTSAQESKLTPRQKETRRILLRAGANPNPRNNAGQTYQQFQEALRR